MKKLNKLYEASANHSVIDGMLKSSKDIPLKKLFSIIQSGSKASDKDVMKMIYNSYKPSDYSRLKSKMKEILIRAISLREIHLESPNSRTNIANNQFRHVLVSKLLHDLRLYDLSIEIAEKALIKSIKYHITEPVIILSRILVKHYGTSEYNKYKLNKYLKILDKYLRIHSWEVKAENYYIDLQRVFLHSLASADDAIVSKAKRYVLELSSIKDIKSYLFEINKYKVEAAYHECRKDYLALLQLSDRTIKKLSTPEYLSNVNLHNINIRKSWALIQAERYDEAIAIGKKDMSKLPSGSLGWYFIAHYTLKAELYKNNYIGAIELIAQMIGNSKFSKIGENYRELFFTTLGYIYLIIDSELFEGLEAHKEKLPEFKLYKFLNTIPVFSKDKRGINVSILLMHIAFLLQRKDYNAIIDRVDSLNQYAYRYLRKDDSFRSNCMIKMVIQMTKADFNPIRTARYTQDLLKQLEQVKLAGSGENIETEIIPYEVLWKIMTKAL